MIFKDAFLITVNVAYNYCFLIYLSTLQNILPIVISTLSLDCNLLAGDRHFAVHNSSHGPHASALNEAHVRGWGLKQLPETIIKVRKHTKYTHFR